MDLFSYQNLNRQGQSPKEGEEDLQEPLQSGGSRRDASPEKSEIDYGNQPLSERMRPRSVDEIIGHEKLIGAASPLGQLLRRGQLTNIIVWGPPGTGKTTFSLAVAQVTGSVFISANAVDLGSKKIREYWDEGRLNLQRYNKKTILFIDEIHRLIRSQQDILLPAIERGELILIGATTENPGYEMSRAFMSRCLVLAFEKLTESDLQKILDRCCIFLKIQERDLVNQEAKLKLFDFCNGDGRRLIRCVEWAFRSYQVDKSQFPLNSSSCLEFTSQFGQDVTVDVNLKYDLISAFIKSMRGSDPDAAVYYLVRLIDGGEDPKYVARRMVILASEDIGNADPRALTVAIDAFKAVEILGLPEGKIPLAQAAIYLASAPKSNKSYLALKAAQKIVSETRFLSVPDFLKSSSKWGIGQPGEAGYRYPHDYPKGYVTQEYLPEEIRRMRFYEASSRGFEKQIQAYQDWLKEGDDERNPSVKK